MNAKAGTVLVTNKMMGRVLTRLNERFTVHKLFENDDKAALLREVGPDVTMVATGGGGGLTGEVFEACPNLGVVASFGVGYDGVDVETCRAKNIRVTNTPDVLNDAMAEITLGLMIALARQIPQADAYTRAGRWGVQGNYPLLTELTGKTIGIVGLGRIGKEVARRAQAFRMQVIYHGRTKQPYEPYPYHPELFDLARTADWVVSIVPGNTGTGGMFDAAFFEALGPDGFFVNVGRGTAVDEAALLSALREGRIAGAALDVFHNEPKIDPAFFDLANVVLSPHQGSATVKTRDAMADLVVDNLIAYAEKRPLLSPVV